MDVREGLVERDQVEVDGHLHVDQEVERDQGDSIQHQRNKHLGEEKSLTCTTKINSQGWQIPNLGSLSWSTVSL